VHKYKDKSTSLKNILFDTNGGQPCSLLEINVTNGYRLNKEAVDLYVKNVKSKFAETEFNNLIKIGNEIEDEKI